MDYYGEFIAGAGITPDLLIITGTGRAGTSTDKWVYQYRGYVVPAWAKGLKQIPAPVGTGIRTIPMAVARLGLLPHS